MPQMVWFDESWNDAVAAFEETREIWSLELGDEVGSKRALVGFVVGPAVVACLWGTEEGVGDFDVQTDPNHRRQGLAEALLRAYVDRYGDRISRFQADPTNDTSRGILERLGFTSQPNGQWVLAV